MEKKTCKFVNYKTNEQCGKNCGKYLYCYDHFLYFRAKKIISTKQCLFLTDHATGTRCNTMINKGRYCEEHIQELKDKKKDSKDSIEVLHRNNWLKIPAKIDKETYESL